MKSLFPLLAIFLVFFGCVSPEENSEILRLNQEKHDLILQTKQKDSVLSAYFQTLNEIEESLGVIKEKEKIITINSQDPEFGKTQGEKIIGDIDLIHEMLEQNKKRLAGVRQQLKGSKLETSQIEGELDRMIKRMNEQLELKDTEIIALKSELSALNTDFEVLLAEYEQEVLDKTAVTDELNTAYFTTGNNKALKENGVVTKEGGIAGLGGTKTLGKNFNRDYFTQIDITETKEIKLSGAKASVLTNHPDGSYTLVGEEKAIEKLVISDPVAFWSVSKYLVILED